jgi:hypothetical protein
MRIEIPFEIRYETPNTVPIEDVIDGLISANLLIEEGGYNLAHFVPGLQIEQVQVGIQAAAWQKLGRHRLANRCVWDAASAFTSSGHSV